jgi:hypothetical protein
MRNALVAVALIAVTGLVIWGAMHVFITQVNPEQPTPSGHFSGACWACHFVSSGAKIIEE